MNRKEHLQTVINAFQKRFKGFEVPDKIINPAKEPANILELHGLPPKPDRRKQPRLRQVWDVAFGQPVSLRKFTHDLDLVEKSGYRSSTRPTHKFPATTPPVDGSNWSGAYITANRDKRFIQIWGKWKVPGNLALPPAPFQGQSDFFYVCSNWIGLDGQRLYLNSSLPQIGTTSKLLPSGQTVCETWVQWWARHDETTGPLPIGLALKPGNEVLCVLTAQDPITVRFVMVNLSVEPAVAIAIQGTAPTVNVDGNPVPLHISGATAEWIVERPEILHETSFYNFPNYGKASFHHCLAVETSKLDIADLPNGLPQELRGARLIRMFDVFRKPDKTAFISVPRKLDQTAIGMTYVGV